MHGRAALAFASTAGCEQMATMPTHIDGGVLDLFLTDVHALVEIQAGSSVGTSDHRAIFANAVLDKPIPHLVCSQGVY